MTGNSAPQNPGVKPWPPPCTQTEKTSLGKRAAQVTGSQGLKLSQRPGTFQPPYGRLTPALCPQLSLQRSFLAQGLLIPKGQRSERGLGVCCSSFRGPTSNGEPLGQQLCLSPRHKVKHGTHSLCHLLFYQRRGPCCLLGYLLLLLPALPITTSSLPTQGGQHSLFHEPSLYYSSMGLRWEGLKAADPLALVTKRPRTSRSLSVDTGLDVWMCVDRG